MVDISSSTELLNRQEIPTEAPSMENAFVEDSILSLTKAFPELSSKEISLIRKTLWTMPIDATNQEEIKNIIHELTISIKVKDQENLPTLIRKIRSDAKDGFEHTNTFLYTQNLLWATPNEGVKSYDADSKQVINTTKDRILEEENSTTTQEKSSAEKIINETANKEKESLKTIKEKIENTDRLVNLSTVPLQYSEKFLNSKPETQKALTLFKEALGYSPNNPENKKISLKATQYLNYHIALGKKVRQASKNTSLTISEEERKQSQEFNDFLRNSDIDPRDFYQSFGGERNFSAQFNEKLPEVTPISAKKESSLVSNLSENPEISTDTLQIDNVFKDIDNTLLLKSFPLPKNMKHSDFFYDFSSSESFVTRMQSLLEASDSYPFLEQSTKDRKTLVVAKKRLVSYLILKNNPQMNQLPENIINVLYPSGWSEKKSKLRGFRKKLVEMPRESMMRQYEEELLLPLMHNNFLNPSIEKDFSHMVKKWYLSYVSTLLEQTPELDEFSYNANEITMTNNFVQLPLYNKGQDTVDSYLSIENWKVFITNSLYNPSDTENIQQLKKWKVAVGQVKGFSEFAQESVKSLPDIIATSSEENNPQLSYFNSFRDNIGKISTDQNDDKESLQENIGHSLSQNKVRNGVKNIMYGRNNDGSLSLEDTKKSNPFYEEISTYEQGEDKKISKENSPITFAIGNFVRTSMLRNSSEENIRLKDSLSKLQKVLTDKSFNENLRSYLKNNKEDRESPKRAMLSLLDPQERSENNLHSKESLVNFLSLFGSNNRPWPDGQYNRIRISSFEQAVNKLASGVPLDLLNTDNIISSTHPVVEKINKKHNSPDALLDTQLEQAFD